MEEEGGAGLRAEDCSIRREEDDSVDAEADADEVVDLQREEEVDAEEEAEEDEAGREDRRINAARDERVAVRVNIVEGRVRACVRA